MSQSGAWRVKFMMLTRFACCCLLLAVWIIGFGVAQADRLRAIPQHPSRVLMERGFQLALQEQSRVTSAMAATAYATMRRTIQRLNMLALQKQEVQKGECAFRRTQDYSCISELHKFHYLPPFPLALPHQVSPRAMMGPYFAWIPMRETRGGAEIVTHWTRLAAAGTPFDCLDTACKVIIRFRNETRDDRLAVCDVLKAPDIIGHPENCQPVAIFAQEKEKETWVYAVIGYKYTSRRRANSPKDTFTIINKDLTEGEILDGLTKDLQSSPLKLTVEIIGMAYLRAYAECRYSIILYKKFNKNWYYCIEIDIIVARAENSPEFRVRVQTELHAIEQNIKCQKYPSANAPQHNIYRDLIRKKLKTYLQSLCISPTLEGDFKVRCTEHSV